VDLQLGPIRRMSLTIIIPTKNRFLDLEIALTSITSQIRSPDQLVLIDQSDNPIPILRSSPFVAACQIRVRSITSMTSAFLA
jgi:hypothetical protein